MRTNDLLDDAIAIGGDGARSGLHLGRSLRAVDCTVDLAAAGTAGSGTLDGSIIRIEAGAHGVRVCHHSSTGAP